MADSDPNRPHRHRHRRPPSARDRRRRALLTALAVLLVGALAAVLGLTLQDGTSATAADPPVPRLTAPPTSPPTTTGAPITTNAATTSDASTSGVPGTFAAALRRIGIPLDPQTGWVVAQGICVRLEQPAYDQFRLAEGVERLFPAVPDAQAHAFVAMVATAVCQRPGDP
jgi:hypothetical protein